MQGIRARHNAQIYTQRNWHTGLVGVAPDSIFGRRIHTVQGIRARHRSLIAKSINLHTGLAPPIPNPAPIRTVKGIRARRRSRVQMIRPLMIDFGRRATILRGLYRVFNTAGYRFYRTDGSPPVEGDAPLEANPTLPHTTVATWADGDWYTSVDFFNGALSSGFLVLGADGETWLRLPISGGAAAGVPPLAPQDVRLQAEAGGVIRVFAIYFESGTDRADEWAIAFTTDGSAPAEDAPDFNVTMATGGVAVLEYALPAQADTTLVRVRVQALRNGTPDVYSEGSGILNATADAIGPTAPLVGEAWPGSLPEEA